jgi:hypothetical protein
MAERYRKSRELGRSHKEPEPIPEEEEVVPPVEETDTEAGTIEVKANFFNLNNYIGDAKEACVVKSDLVGQITNLEEASGRRVVGLGVMEDGSVMLLLEEW